MKKGHDIAVNGKSELSHSIYSAIFNNSLDTILLTSPDGSIYTANPAACRMFGRTEEEIIKYGRSLIIDTEDPRLIAALKLRDKHGSFKGEMTGVKSDGTKFPIEIASSVFIDDNGNKRTTIIIRDITRRKQLEEERLLREQKFRSLFENTDGSIWSIDTNLRLAESNQVFLMRFKQVTGRLMKPGDDVIKGLPAELKKEWTRYYKRGLAGEHFTIETSTLKPLEPMHFRYSFNPIRDQKGIVNGLTIIGYNITDRVQAEEKLKNSEERYRMLSEQGGIGIGLYSPEGEILYFNTKALENLGGKLEDYIGKNLKEVFGEVNGNIYLKRIKKSIRLNQSFDYEDNFEAHNGKFWFLSNYTPVFNSSGSVVGVQILAHDNTRRKNAELALAESEKKYRSLFDLSVVPIWEADFSDVKQVFDRLREKRVRNFKKYFDQNGNIVRECSELVKILDMNETSFSFFGAKNQEEVRNNLLQYYIPESMYVFRDILVALAEGKDNFTSELPLRFSSGELVYIQIILQVQPGFTDSLSRVLISWINISDRINYERALEETGETLRELNKHIEEARDKERTLISLNLHDDLGQKITAIKMDLAWIKKRIGVQSKLVSDKVEGIDILLDDAIDTIKRISSDLRPTILYDLGLPIAVEWLVNDRIKNAGIKVKLTIIPADFELEPSISVAMFRLFQESVTNILRHSKADQVSIRLIKKNGAVILRIKDNGIGFDNVTINDHKSLGLFGMKERVRSLNGKLNIISKPLKGTLISIEIPIK